MHEAETVARATFIGRRAARRAAFTTQEPHEPKEPEMAVEKRAPETRVEVMA